MKNYKLTLLLAGVLSIVIMVWAMPRESKFGYSYEVGRPWHYAPLIAAYDFPVYKSEEQQALDRDSAMAYFRPYYHSVDSMALLQGRHLLSDWQAGRMGSVPYNYVAHVGRLLEEVYANGVVSNEDMSRLNNEKSQAILLVDGSHAQAVSVGGLMTPLAAYEYIMRADTIHYKHGELSRLQLNHYLAPNLQYDSIRSRRSRNDILNSVSATVGMVQIGQKIIDQGEIVTDYKKLYLDSYKRESEIRKDASSNFRYLLAGQLGMATFIVVLMMVYLALYRRDVMQSSHHVAMLFTLVTIFPLCSSLMVGHNLLSVYMLPYAMAPILTRVFVDSRTAVMVLIGTVLLSSLSLHEPYAFVMIEMVAGLIAVYSLRELSSRAQIFRTALEVGIGTCVFSLFFDFMGGATFSSLNKSMSVYLVISGILLLFTYPLMYLVERLFAFTSDVTLIELTNINHPLLRRMSKVAQGTFVHSMQVANLAAEVANKIGASSLLVRTGALYHDIGKMQSPAFFTENQAGHNPHDQLAEEQSAGIIISHVTEGLKMAEKHNLPEEVRDFIQTHHGHTRVGYFYNQAINRRGEERVNAADFTYPGRNPFTREQGILMMADAVEAASRSLGEYTEESVQQLVDRIIDGQLMAGNFKECPLSFRDVTLAKQVLVESLKTIYHTRVAYPEIIKK